MNNNWNLILKPVSGWFNINLKELWHSRDLIRLFFYRDFIVFYKQTILGPLWFVIQPLLTTIVFTIIFGKVANLSTNNIPHILFYMSGTIVWNYFSTCLVTNSRTFIDNKIIFGKVYYPRLIMPISTVLINLLTFFIQILLLFCFWFYYYFQGVDIRINLILAMFPLLIVHLAMLGLGTGIIISSLTTKYRDLNFVVTFGVQLWMYATPIVYPVSIVPERFHWLIFLNPMTMVVETFKLGLFNSGYFDFYNYLLSFLMSAAILVFGIILFSRIEKTFMDKI